MNILHVHCFFYNHFYWLYLLSTGSTPLFTIISCSFSTTENAILDKLYYNNNERNKTYKNDFEEALSKFSDVEKVWEEVKLK